MIIRPATPADLPAMESVIAATGLFPPDLLGGMIAGYLAGGSAERWLVTDGVAGLAYVAPERMTDGTFNLLLIAVDPARQGQGIGAALVGAVERVLAAQGGRLLLVETSGLPEFAAPCGFYNRLGFVETARIPAFYAAGEDKLIFCKPL